MNCLFMYNPVSGRGKINKKLKIVEKHLKERFDEVEIYATTAPKDMQKKAKEACSKFDYLVFSGGDGSFNEVVNGIANEEVRPVLGYIPTGTVNDVARSNKIPRHSVKKALDVINEGKPIYLDIMQINEDYATYVAATGSMTACSYTADQNDKRKRGRIAYLREILFKKNKIESFPTRITGDGVDIQTYTSFIMILNSRSVGSLPIKTDAILDDGRVDLAVLKQYKKPNFFQRIFTFFRIAGFLLFGYNSLQKRWFDKLSGSSFKIEVPEDKYWNYDGERGTMGSVELKVLPKHIKLMVSKKMK